MLTTYKIFPIYLGEIPVHDKSSFTYMVDPGVKMTCPFISFLLLGSNGRKILVDTGPCDTEWGAKYHNLYRLVSQKIFPVGLTKRACRF